jgi:hypothetical protein
VTGVACDFVSEILDANARVVEELIDCSVVARSTTNFSEDWSRDPDESTPFISESENCGSTIAQDFSSRRSREGVDGFGVEN